jgi:hypothetical protein
MTEKVGFALTGIRTEQFAIFEENFTEGIPAGLITGLEFKISKEKKQLGVYATFTFEQKKQAFIKIQVSSHFKISPTSWKGYCSSGKIVIPKKLITHLTMLTIGTARGVLHAKTENTPFHKFLLPTIDVTKLVTKDTVFPLQ